MSLVKRMMEVDRSIWLIGDRHRKNPYLGHRVAVKWKRPWGGKPAGYRAEGTLKATFCKNGRTLIGLIELPTGKTISAPWSRNWLDVEVIS